MEFFLFLGRARKIAGVFFLVKHRAIPHELRAKLLGWRYCGGFSAHNWVRVAAEDREGRIKLAGYMIRAPLSLEKMTHDAATGTVIYRSQMHAGLKRNFQVMPGAEWPELLCKHIPDRYEHLVHYVGWYSNRARGERAKALETLKAQDPATKPAASIETVSAFATRGKATWARLSAKSTKPTRSSAPSAKAPCA